MGGEGHFIHGGGFKGKSKGSYDNETPIDILKKRYARGEIDEEEFQRRRKQLEN